MAVRNNDMKSFSAIYLNENIHTSSNQRRIHKIQLENRLSSSICSVHALLGHLGVVLTLITKYK